MSQSSVKAFFPTRKRPAVGEVKSVTNASKALLLDDSVSTRTAEDDVQQKLRIVHVTPVEDKTEKKLVRFPHVHHSGSGSATKAKVRKKLNYPADESTRKSSNLMKSFFKPAEVQNFIPEVQDTESGSKNSKTQNVTAEISNLETERQAPDISNAPLLKTEIKTLLSTEESVISLSKDKAEHGGPSTPLILPAAGGDSVEEPHASERPSTPENSPSVEQALFNDLGLNDLKVRINRSKRYNALKDSLQRYSSRDARLKEIASRLQACTDQQSSEPIPKVEEFGSFEIEVPVSPAKSPLKPQRLFFSPTKSPRKGLATPSRLDFSSPVKSNVYVSPRKLLDEKPSPVKIVPCHLKFEALVNGDALILPFKYRGLFEIFCAVDRILSLFHNRHEKITFTKLKSGVQEMLRRNFLESHLAQIKTVSPEAFEFSQEKYQVFGKRSEAEYHLIIKPVFNDEKSDKNCAHPLMTPSVLATRKREFNKSLLEITKLHHREFLLSLDPPLDIPVEKVTRWHAEFEVNAVPDIPLAEIPVSPALAKKLSARDVLDNAKSLLSANARVAAAMDSLNKRLERKTDEISSETSSKPLSSFSVPCHNPNATNDALAAVSKALKGVPQSFLDKIKAKQAARAVEAMTRSPAQNKKAVMMSRLPEIARILRNLFVVERKSVLPLDQVTTKLQHSCKENMTPSEIKSHLLLIQEFTPEWLSLCLVRNADYVKLLRTANVEAVMLKLKTLVENEGRIYHCR